MRQYKIREVAKTKHVRISEIFNRAVPRILQRLLGIASFPY